MDFPSAQNAISTALVDTVRGVSQVSAHDVSYHRSAEPSLESSLNRQNGRLLSLAEKLLRSTASSLSASSIALPNAEAIEDNWSSIVDVADSLLEKTDACLDEFSGLRRNGSSGQQASSLATKIARSKLREAFRTQDLQKPQLLFEHPPDNYAAPPFRPILSRKPHSSVALDDSLRSSPNEYGLMQYQNPYEQEIKSYRYPPSIYKNREPVLYTPFESTTAVFVDDLDSLHEMVRELKHASEIAIDLEHHDAHSYVGVVCLMQISTRDRDWIVDTLKPWRRKLEILNEVFADPKIVKVLHGASMDIIWLQRDFGLYIVGLFDTYAAARALGYSSHGLAYLLKHFVNIDAQKQYQLADWRIRPLPTELFEYARSDTHFLLYIYDSLCNDLLARSDLEVANGDKIEDVLQDSMETALRRYEYATTSNSISGGWYKALQRTTAMSSFSAQQIAAFRDIYHWRDAVARDEDENIFAVLPGYVMSNIVLAMPKDIPSLLAVSHPISTYLRQRAGEIIKLINDAAASDGILVSRKKTTPLRNADVGSATFSEPLSSRWYPPTPHETPVDVSAPSRETLDQSTLRMDFSRFWGPKLSEPLTFSAIDDRVLTDDTMISLCPALWSTSSASPGNETALMNFSQSHSFNSGDMAPFDTENGKAGDLGPARRAGDSIVSKREWPGSDSVSTLSNPNYGSEDVPTEVKPRAARKALRKAKHSHGTSDVLAGSVNDSLTPVRGERFDYECAPSMLHFKGSVLQPAQQKTPHNPYIRAADVPVGVKAASKPSPGRSATFNS